MRTLSLARVAVALSFGALALAPTAASAAACTPTNLCVNHNGRFPGVYTIDNGNGAVAARALTFNAGTTYTFELQVTLASHPFFVTTSSTGPGGTQLTAPIIEGSVSFTPTGTTPVNLFYQCDSHSGMGGAITVSGGGDAAPRLDAGSEAGTDAGSDGGSSSSSSSSTSSSSSASSASSGGTAGNTAQPATEDGGCSVGAAGASAWFGLSIAALVQFAARRRRRNVA